MSVVVYRDGILAADRLACYGNVKEMRSKLFVIDDPAAGRLPYPDGDKAIAIAYVGGVSSGQFLVNWYKTGADADKWPWSLQLDEKEGAYLVLLRKLKGEPRVSWYEASPSLIPFPRGNFVAFGSAADMAYGALEMGASAIDAVLACCRRHNTVGGGCDYYDIINNKSGYFPPSAP